MGMYDTFVGEIKCPICGMMAEINEQTKSYDCLLMDIKLGDCIDEAGTNYSVPVDSHCKECGSKFISYAIVKAGRLVEYSFGFNNQEKHDGSSTNKIIIRGDRNNSFIKAYMDLSDEQKRELNKVLRVTLFDGYPLQIFESED